MTVVAIKMDELLVNWICKDQVYSKVLNLIENLRVSSTESESNPSNGTTGDPSLHPTDVSSADSMDASLSSSSHSNKKHPPYSALAIPPFYRPPGTLAPDGTKIPPLLRRKKGLSSIPWKEDQTWDGMAAPLTSTSNSTITTENETASTTTLSSFPPPPPPSPSLASTHSGTPTSLSQNQPSSHRSLTPVPPIKDQMKAIFMEYGKVLPSFASTTDILTTTQSIDSSSSSSSSSSPSKLFHLYLTRDQFVRVTKDMCYFPSFFNGPLYKRILYLWNVKDITDEKVRQRIWDMYSPKTQSMTPFLETTTVTSLHPSQQEKEGGEEEEEENFESWSTLMTHWGKDLSTVHLPSSLPNRKTSWEKVVITYDMIQWYWRQEMEDYDIHDRFYRLLKKPHVDHVSKEDFMPFIRELLNDHPGLDFLSNHTEFQEKYAITVIARIFYCVNRCHSGRITARQIRRSDLLRAFAQVEEEEDINRVTRYFSYEHFYVLYCRFWELDMDRDYRITRKDLQNYGDGCLNHMIIDRIFDAAPRPFGGSSDASSSSPSNTDGDRNGISASNTISRINRDYMTYEDFIFFMLSEEDKANEISIRYWFTCLDVDGDGKLNNMEMRSFYAVQIVQMQRKEVQEIVPFKDMLCQMMDMIKPRNKEFFIVEDFLQPHCLRVSGLLFDALFNVNKYLQFEQRDPFMEKGKREEGYETDWDRFAFYDYNRLAMEEEQREEEAMEIDWVTGDDDDEVSSGYNTAGSSEAPF